MKQKEQYSAVELFRIARRQRIIRCLLVVTVLTIWIPFASLVMGVIGSPFIYRLGKALHSTRTWLFVIAAFIPFIDLIGLLILNRMATLTLRRNLNPAQGVVAVTNA